MLLQNKVLIYVVITNTIWGQEEKAKPAQLLSAEKRVAFGQCDSEERNKMQGHPFQAAEAQLISMLQNTLGDRQFFH